MSHIEFIGPPGAGKSTLHSRLTLRNESLYGSLRDDAIRRQFLKKASSSQRILYKIFPQVIKQFFEDEFLQYRIKNHTLAEFIDDFPDSIRVLSEIFEELDDEFDTVLFMFQKAVNDYQLGMSTINSHERLCLDEGFMMAAVATIWRTGTQEFPYQSYLKVFPTPSVIIYLDAPTDLCVARQKNRERAVTTNKDNDLASAIERHRKACDTIVDQISSETAIIHEKNNKSVEKVITQLEAKLRRTGEI